MSTDRKTLVIIISLSLSFIVTLCVLGYIRIRSFLNIVEVSQEGQAPIRSLRLTIDESQRDELFDQLQKFADKHEFEYELTDFNTNGENFQFSMMRNDVTIIASDIPPDQTLVKIRLYAKYPGYTVDESTIDELFTDLKVFLSEILSVKIIEEN